MTTTQSTNLPVSGPSAADIAEHAGRGGRIATIISLSAFLFSGLSFYESVLKQADLEVFVPPVMHYARDFGGDADVFTIPITIANDGATNGTVLSMELTVENLAEKAEPKTRTYYSAYVGEHLRDAAAPKKSFAPISIPGRGVYTETIRFYPQGSNLPKLVTEKGDYQLSLKLNVAQASGSGYLAGLFRSKPPAPLVFTRKIAYISDQSLGFRRDTIPMFAKDWQPTTSGAK